MKSQLNRAPLTGDKDEPVAGFLSPEVTTSKVARIERMSTDKNPKIRESAALSCHASGRVYLALAEDEDEGVRTCLARNPRVPFEVLRILSEDESERVRAFVAANVDVPSELLDTLAVDSSLLVRQIAEWKMGLRHSDLVPN